MIKLAQLIRRLACRSDASEVAEAAAVLPLLFMLVMAIYWFGQAFSIYGTLAQAARAGARAAITPSCTTCAAAGTGPAQNAQTAVQNALAAAHINTNSLLPTSQWTAPAQCACGSASPNSCRGTVACDGSVTNMCVQENIQLSYPVQGAMGTCGTAVSMMYQNKSYSFAIPMTNLNLAKMKLPAQAEMRVETQ